MWKWTNASPSVIAAFILFFATLLSILILYYISIRRRDKLTEEEVSEKFFIKGCERFKLKPEEIKDLRELAAYVPEASTQAHLIFDTPLLFERCAEAYVTRVIRSGQPTDDYELALHCLREKLGYGALSPDHMLMSTRNLEVGQKVSVYTHGPDTHPRVCQVVRVGEIYFTVRAVDDKRGVHVLAGANIKITFLRQGDAAYTISVRVRGGGGADVDFFHTIKFSRNQSRRYMRLEISLPLRYRVVESGDPKAEPTEETLQATTLDISGGGICFMADNQLKPGDIILHSIQIPGDSLGGIRSKVLKIIPIEKSETLTHYKHLLQFVGIELQQREKIIKFIFEKQREVIQMR